MKNQKKIEANSIKMYYVEEIRTGRKEVILQTLYKQKKPFYQRLFLR